QLKNAVEYAVILAGSGREIGADCLPGEILNGSKSKIKPRREENQSAAGEPLPLKEIERQAIEAALKRHNGNKAAAAKELGIGLKTIYRKVEEYQIEG
ncbi:AAA family ATPase, partial [bacterium]|nr:AAA family ATPase [bacterium]